PLDPRVGVAPEPRRAALAAWELEWEPGSRFEYHTSSAHWVLVDLVERVTGLDFRDALEQRVTAPLGLPRVLGVPRRAQGDLVDGVVLGAERVENHDDVLALANDAEIRSV